MQTAEATPIHPLVAKAAKRWIDLAARYNVPAEIEPMMPEDTMFGIGGVFVRIDTGRRDEMATVAIYPPRTAGRKPIQSAIHLRYRNVRGKMRFGSVPKVTLRDMAFAIVWFWNRPEVSA